MKRDPKTALKWYRKAAEQNHPMALYCLGVMYYNGYGPVTDGPEAERLLRRSALLGCTWAAYRLGDLFVNGCQRN